MLELKFNNPVFNDGVNVTVRKSGKWNSYFAYKARTAKIDENRIADLLAVNRIQFLNIPQTWLDLEHDPKCRNLSGLYEAMVNAYKDFYIGDYVDVVFFLVKDNNANNLPTEQ